MTRRLFVSATAVTLLTLAGYFVAGSGTRAAGLNPDAMSIDMNPTGAREHRDEPGIARSLRADQREQ